MHSPDLYGPAEEDGGETGCQSQDEETNKEGETGQHEDSSPPSQVGYEASHQTAGYTRQSPAGSWKKIKIIILGKNWQGCCVRAYIA